MNCSLIQALATIKTHHTLLPEVLYFGGGMSDDYTPEVSGSGTTEQLVVAHSWDPASRRNRQLWIGVRTVLFALSWAVILFVLLVIIIEWF